MASGTMEITTVIGCKIRCKYCPQSTLVEKYSRISNNTNLSLDTFQKCIDKIPNYVEIHFSGMAEPWLNPDCTDMVLYASQKGYPITIYTTLVGMNLKDFEQIKNLDFVTFAVHLPDYDSNAHIPIDKNYLTVFESVFQHFRSEERKKRFEVSCHGPVHAKVRDLIPRDLIAPEAFESLQSRMIDRAGHIDSAELPHFFHKGPVMCQHCSRLLNRNILLPNGDVLLCCMDYGMEYVLGNLLTDDYQSLFRSPVMLNVKKC